MSPTMAEFYSQVYTQYRQASASNALKNRKGFLLFWMLWSKDITLSIFLRGYSHTGMWDCSHRVDQFLEKYTFSLGSLCQYKLWKQGCDIPQWQCLTQPALITGLRRIPVRGNVWSWASLAFQSDQVSASPCTLMGPLVHRAALPSLPTCAPSNNFTFTGLMISIYFFHWSSFTIWKKSHDQKPMENQKLYLA